MGNGVGFVSCVAMRGYADGVCAGGEKCFEDGVFTMHASVCSLYIVNTCAGSI